MKKKANNTTIHVVTGDLTRVKADVMHNTDALIITIDSSGEVHDKINFLVQTVGGNYYHDRLRAHMPLDEFEVVFAQGTHLQHPNPGACFDSVIFVVDNDEPSQEEDVFLGLTRANGNGLRSVAMPFFGAGHLRNVADSAIVIKAVDKTLRGLQRFLEENKATTVQDILFVFDGAPDLQRIFEDRLAALKIG